MNKTSLSTSIQVIILFFGIFAGVYFAKPFLAPFAIAAMLAMLFLPLAKKLEKKKVSKAIAILVCLLILLIAIAGIVALISTQVANVQEDMPKIKQNLNEQVSSFKQYLSQHLGVSPQQQQEAIQKQQSGGGQSAKMVTTIMSSIGSMLVDTVLVFVYIFLLLFFRTHLKKFVLKLLPDDKKENGINIMSGSVKVVSQYLGGLAAMIVILWIMYGIGFSIVGVKNAIFFAILCGLLEIIPFVGNLAGTGITIIMSFAQGGGTQLILGILITYGIVQFVQTYILEPLVVGSEVNINPLFTIIAIVVGELVWGVAGMVLAIPTLGIIKIICDNVEPLKPYGFLIGKEKKQGDSTFKEKLKNLFNKAKG